MSHQDGNSERTLNREVIKQVLDWLLPPDIVAGSGGRGNGTWRPRLLAATALLWAVSGEAILKDRFEQARKIVARVFHWLPAPGRSYQGFMKMLGKRHDRLMRAAVGGARKRMQDVMASCWRIAGHLVFATDGSRIELSRTLSLEAAYSPKKKKRRKRSRKQSAASIAKKATSPQMWLTLVWHVGSGLPWAWRTGPSDSSERGHAEEMLAELPEGALLTADAGFIGYAFWQAILDGGRHFVVRVGANVRLIRHLGYVRQHEHTVYLWPDQAAKKNQPPLALRLIVIHDGKQTVYLVTDLSKASLSDRQATEIYAARWGIEVFFRTLKQTFGRRKLRSRCAANARLELDWSLLGLWCVCLLGQRELVEQGAAPSRLSPVAAIRAIQATLRDWRVRPDTVAETLWNRLRLAMLDDYERASPKTSRNYPRKKKRSRIGPPKLSEATTHQIAAAKQLKKETRRFRLSA